MHIRGGGGRGALLLAAVILAVRAQAGSLEATAHTGDTGSPRIVNGTLTSLYPSTGALLTPGDPLVASLECTGTLIGCDTFLTAAHCVCNGKGSTCQGPNAPFPGSFIVFFQHAGLFAVSSIAVHPDFNFPVADVAILKLATPVTGIAPTPIDGTRAPAAGDPGTIVGFGRSGGDPAANVDYGLKRAGTVTLAPCETGVSNATSICWTFAQPLGPPGTNSDTCNGDSGGPLFFDVGCGPTVAGITSGGISATCLPTDASYDANVYAYRDFIATAGGADVQSESCGAMPQAGDPNTTITPFSGTLDPSSTGATHSFPVPAGTTELRVALNGVDDGSDFDLFLKRGAPATPTDFDCKADGQGQFGFCGFNAPAADTWYAFVRRFSGSGLYQLTVTTFGTGGPGSGTDGQPCNDRNVCTAGDACLHGNCAGPPAADGTPCDDGSACTQPDTCQAGICTGTAAPASGCHQPLVTGRSTLLVRDSSLDTRDRLTWRWASGDAPASDLGDPTTDAAYELCIFDESSGTPIRALDAHIPAGGPWTATRSGWRYKDRTLTNDGISSIVLKAGTGGSGSVAVKGKGGGLALSPPPYAQDPAVLVQLIDQHACWQARYSRSLSNAPGLFKAKSD